MRSKRIKTARRLAAAAAVVVAFCASCFAIEFRRAGNNLDDVFAASCRVNVSGARGTGTFNGEKDGLAYISTNYHVVSNQRNATVDFWTNGVRQTLTGRVAWRAYDAGMPADFAFIVVDAETLKREVDPPYVALGGTDAKPSVNSFFLSSGGPRGLSVKAWKGKVLDYFNGETVLFQPHPVPGQSGSGVFEEIDGELFQVGIITWLIGAEGDDDSKGGAIPISNLYKALRKNPYQVVAPNNENGSPIPPGAVECDKDGKDGKDAAKEGGDVSSALPVTFLSARPGAAYGARPALSACVGKWNARAVLFREVSTVSPRVETVGARVLYFTAQNCAACELLAPDIKGILDAGEIPVEIVDASTEDGGALVKRYGIDVAPTAVIVDHSGKERARVSFEEMKVRTPYIVLSNAYAAVVDEIDKERAQQDETPATPAIVPATPKQSQGGEDFRTRAAFYEIPPDVSFFDDSDDRWRRRGGKRFDTPKNYAAPPENGDGGDTPDSSPENGGSASSSRLFDKLGDRLEKRLENVIKRATQDAGSAIGDELEQRIGGALSGDVSRLMQGIEDGIKDKIENSAKATARRYAWRIFWCLLGVVFVGQVVFSIFRRVVAAIWSKVILTAETLVAARENLLTGGRANDSGAASETQKRR